MAQAEVDFSRLVNLLKAGSEKSYVLCDENTYQYCYNVFTEQVGMSVQPIVIKAGEAQKNISICEFIWKTLLDNQAGKETILINLGGGVVSDIGGFVAATYKRGIKYVNVPTSLLAMVDAASGGKTGINFEHFKNIIGVIHQPELVVIHTPFLQTLPYQHIKNGFAEMLKHALLHGGELLNEILNISDLSNQIDKNSILRSLSVKELIVTHDPYENGLRKTLNLGHTIGHAIEFAAFENGYEILHGEAIAIGIIAALKLSERKLNFDAGKAETIIQFIRKLYPTPVWLKQHQSSIITAIKQDKKNINQTVRMVLLKEVGASVYDVSCAIDEIIIVLNEI